MIKFELGVFSCKGPINTLLVRDDILVRTSVPNDYKFIDSLMKEESSSVGFLQERTFSKYVWGNERNFLLFICEVNSDKVGYVFLTPGKHGGLHRILKIQQMVVRKDARRLEYGTALLDCCVAFGKNVKASGISLRCRSDLEANLFWNALGFTLTQVLKAGTRNHMIGKHLKTFFNISCRLGPWPPFSCWNSIYYVNLLLGPVGPAPGRQPGQTFSRCPRPRP